MALQKTRRIESNPRNMSTREAESQVGNHSVLNRRVTEISSVVRSQKSNSRSRRACAALICSSHGTRIRGLLSVLGLDLKRLGQAGWFLSFAHSMDWQFVECGFPRGANSWELFQREVATNGRFPRP